MPFSEADRASPLASLRANKLRSFLTVLGILIGVSSVIAVVAITEGLDRYIAEQGAGARAPRASPSQKMPDIITSREQWLEMKKRKRPHHGRPARRCATACDACAEVGGQVCTGRERRSTAASPRRASAVTGITENIPRIGTVRELHRGPPPRSHDDIEAARAGGRDRQPTWSDAFFGQMEPLGKDDPASTATCSTVVGVAEKKGSVFGESQDNFVWIPITTFRKLYGTRRSVTIQAEAASMDGLRGGAGPGARGRCARGATSASTSPTTSTSRPARACMELWQNATRGIYVVTMVVTGDQPARGRRSWS